MRSAQSLCWTEPICFRNGCRSRRRCSCGSRDYAIQVRRAAVDLVCKACGAKLRLPAATDEDLDRLCCQMSLTIKGQ